MSMNIQHTAVKIIKMLQAWKRKFSYLSQHAFFLWVAILHQFTTIYELHIICDFTLKYPKQNPWLWQYNPFDFNENLCNIWKKPNSYEKSFKKNCQHKVESWKWRHLFLSISNTAIRNNSNVSNRNIKTLLV